MTLGSFCIVKNEARWIGFHILAALPHVDEMVFFDGNSTDGTVEIIQHLQSKYQEVREKVRLYINCDPKDLKDDYVRVFNECLKAVTTDYAWFLHPDMIVLDGPRDIGAHLAYSVRMRNLGGDPGGPILEFVEGRSKSWKTIMKNDLGIHYFGHYGAWNEDMYFSEVTGDEHQYHHEHGDYPFDVGDSGIRLLHYSDVRPHARRLERMIRVLETQQPALTPEARELLARQHARVSLSPHGVFTGFLLKPFTDNPAVFREHAAELAAVLGVKPEELCPVPLEVVSAQD